MRLIVLISLFCLGQVVHAASGLDGDPEALLCSWVRENTVDGDAYEVPSGANMYLSSGFFYLRKPRVYTLASGDDGKFEEPAGWTTILHIALVTQNMTIISWAFQYWPMLMYTKDDLGLTPFQFYVFFCNAQVSTPIMDFLREAGVDVGAEADDIGSLENRLGAEAYTWVGVMRDIFQCLVAQYQTRWQKEGTLQAQEETLAQYVLGKNRLDVWLVLGTYARPREFCLEEKGEAK